MRGAAAADQGGCRSVTLPPGVRDARRVGGGDINEAFRVVLADGREAFVKTRASAAPGEYQAEAAGLAWLAQAGGVRTPAVLEIARGVPGARVGGGRPSGRGRRRGAGSGPRATHAAGAPAFGAPPGAGEAAGFGSLRLSNEPAADWPSFYSERRIAPLTAIARERGCCLRAPGGASCASASGWGSSRARRSPRRAFTATCGRATCMRVRTGARG